ncbi:hypothetical protein EHQ59_07450 [Leptospira kemamanensis]|uniref:Uncharacterized protein n=1 Tax=Leptospira kemamanensis TaxID=2484942 RepID=A0A4R9JQP4_9LEPT|nr:hypothetical protein [Leptospira kemamanensis]TGL54462.1 hypothetical protein EHQ59_07450 [Leptospira kemamanensis]
MLIISIVNIFLCKPLSLNNPADPNSKSYFENAVVLCALGVYDACKSCKPAPGPWDSFVGTATSGTTLGFGIKVDRNYNSYSIGQSQFNFPGGGVGFTGTPGSDINFFITKKNATGGMEWFNYIGKRSDARFDVLLREDDGVYFFLATDTSLPLTLHPFAGTVGTTGNAVVGKLNFNGEFLWTTYINDSVLGSNTRLGSVIDSLDGSGLYLFGYTTTSLTNNGTLLGTYSGEDWFIRKLSYEGTTLWTKVMNVPGDVTYYNPIKITEIPNGSGFYLSTSVSTSAADLSVLYPNGKNVKPANSTKVVVKLDQNFDYQWYRYVGSGANTTDLLFISDLAYSDSSFTLGSTYGDAVFSQGLNHPNPLTGDATQFFLLDGSGNENYSSFIYKITEYLTHGTARLLDQSTDRFILSGSRSASGVLSGYISEVNRSDFLEISRYYTKGNTITSFQRHCDGSYTAIGFSSVDIENAIIPKGSTTFNSFVTRFKP